MKDRTVFCFNLLFGDYFAKVSNQAKLYYINLNFYADKGFVPNPIGVLDSLGYDKSIYWELINNGELLTLPGRSEVFITSYYVHNNKLNPKQWYDSPFSIYWINKLYIKKNGVATFNPNGIFEPKEPLDQLNDIKTPDQEPKKEIDNVQPKPKKEKMSDEEWQALLKEIDSI